jgi:hypothetical protein
MTEDLIIGDDDEVSDLSLIEIIENQLTVITTMAELDSEAYDALTEDRIKAISQAMKLIHRSQRAIMSQL